MSPIVSLIAITTVCAAVVGGWMQFDTTQCQAFGCKRGVDNPVYVPAINNCGQYVTEGPLTGADGACDCVYPDAEEGGRSCEEDNPDCVATITYTISPPNNDLQVCEWTNYPATPATYTTNGYGAAGVVTLSVAGCGSEDEARAFLSGRPSSGPDNCRDNMFKLCTMTFKLRCASCGFLCD